MGRDGHRSGEWHHARCRLPGMRALVAKVLQWTGIVGDAFGLITIIGIGVAGMTAAAATLVQVVEELALGPQIVFLIAAFVFTWAIVVAMLRPVPRIFSRLSNRYRWLRLPRWLRDDAPLLTNTQHQQLLWLERLLAPEQAQPASRIRLGPPKSDWSHFNDDLAYFDIVLPVTNASIHRVAIQIPLATGNLSWQGAPLAVPPILDSIDRRSDSSISILPGDTIEMTLRQRLQPDEVKAIRESMLQADAVVGIDFSSYRLPFTLSRWRRYQARSLVCSPFP